VEHAWGRSGERRPGAHLPAPPADRCGRADRPGHRAGDDPLPSVHLLAVSLDSACSPRHRVSPWPLHKAAWTNLNHRAATIDTLISMGTSAALLWSLYALFFGPAGTPGMSHPFELTIAPSDGAANIYLEVGAGVTMFILAGRYFEKRSKRQAG